MKKFTPLLALMFLFMFGSVGQLYAMDKVNSPPGISAQADIAPDMGISFQSSQINLNTMNNDATMLAGPTAALKEIDSDVGQPARDTVLLLPDYRAHSDMEHFRNVFSYMIPQGRRATMQSEYALSSFSTIRNVIYSQGVGHFSAPAFLGAPRFG